MCSKSSKRVEDWRKRVNEHVLLIPYHRVITPYRRTIKKHNAGGEKSPSSVLPKYNIMNGKCLKR